MIIKITDPRKPQKEKYRIFAWKTKEKPYEAWETNSHLDTLRKASKYLLEGRDFNVNIRRES